MRIALVLIACAGLGFLAGSQKPATCEKVAAVTPELNDNTSDVIVPATPLVANLLSGGGASDAPSKAAPPAVVKQSLTPRDGQRTADGFFAFDDSRGIWAPVDFGHTRYTENGHASTVEHLIREHGHARSSAEKWTQYELEIAHANSHWWEKTHGAKRQVAAPVYSSACPNGQCGNPGRSRGLFRRR